MASASDGFAGRYSITCRSPFDSARNPPLPTKPPPHAAMAEVHGRAVHERATPDDALDAASLALADGYLGDAAFAEGPVEPDSGNAALAALANDLDRDVRMGGDDDAVDIPRNRSEV